MQVQFNDHFEHQLKEIAELIDTASNQEKTLSDGTSLCPGLGMPDEAARLREFAKDLSVGQFILITAGAFNNGKSTLINSLIGRNTLPTGAVRTTAIITRLFQGEAQRITLVFKNGDREEIEWDTFVNEFCLQPTETKSEDAQKIQQFEKIKQIDIQIPHKLLASGVSIIDSPGLSEHERRTQLVLDHLPRAHSVIVVIDAQRPFAKDERQFIHLLGTGQLSHVFFVINRVDTLNSEEEHKEVQAHALKRLRPFFTDENGRFNQSLFAKRVFFTNALGALEARSTELLDESAFKDSGVGDLSHALNDFLQGVSRQNASFHSALQSLTLFRYQAEQRVNLAKEAFKQPLDILQEKQSAVSTRIATMQASVENIHNQVTELADVIKYQVYGSLLDYVDEMKSTWPHDVNMLDLEKLSNFNIMSKRISAKEKEEFALALQEELQQYIQLKLVQWAQRLSAVIGPSIEDLFTGIHKDIALFNLKVEQLTEWFAGSGSSSTGLTRKNTTVISIHNTDALIPGNILSTDLVDTISKSVMNGISGMLKDPDMLKTIGLSSLAALLMAAGFALAPGAGLATIFALALGQNLVQIFQMRNENRLYAQAMEERYMDRAFGSLGSKKVEQLQTAVKDMLVKDLQDRLFEQIHAQVIRQRDPIFRHVHDAFDQLGNQLREKLNAQTQQIITTQKALVQQKQKGQEAVNEELDRHDAVLQAFDSRFEAMCINVYGRILSKEEIHAVGKNRTLFLTQHGNQTSVTEITEHLLEDDVFKIPDSVDSVLTAPSTNVESDQLEASFSSEIQKAVTKAMGLPQEANQMLSKEDARIPSAKLAGLIGLKRVKEHIIELIDYQAEMKRRAESGLNRGSKPSMHLVFAGNPGTGKTTVAEIIGELYKTIGLLKKGHVEVVGREHLVGQFVGSTAPKTLHAIEKALDGVLFIDEAYSLTQNQISGGSNDFGQESISVLLQSMEQYRDRLAVIVAGYPKKMEEFLKSNPGLSGRFPRGNHISFPDYSPPELMQILDKMLREESYSLDEEARARLIDTLEGLYASRNEHFSNAREVRNLVESLKFKHAQRVRKSSNLPVDEPIRGEDIPAHYVGFARDKGESTSIAHILQQLDRLIGLQPVKDTVKQLIARIKLERKLGESLRMEALHMVFMGNPGTGKTTVAKTFGDLLATMGHLRHGQLIEARATDLIAGYVGQSAPKTRSIVEKALDGVLFIDEAYALVGENTLGGGTNFGDQAIAELLALMEEHRDRLVVIFAGYPHEMQQLLDANSGLRSRIHATITFPDLQIKELMQVMDLMASEKGFTLSSAARGRVDLYLQHIRKHNPRGFGNAREVRKLLDEMINRFARRNDDLNLLDEDSPRMKSMILEAEDVPELPRLKKAPPPKAAILSVETENPTETKEIRRDDLHVDFEFLPPAADRSR